MKSVDIDAAVVLFNRQIESISKRQDENETKKKKGKLDDSRMTGELMVLARGLAAWCAEMRKSNDEVDASLEQATPERIAGLALKLIRRLSPEHRDACRLLIDQLNGKLIAHDGGGE